MKERLLERISLSKYKDKFILKGGFLIASIVGLDTRATMDMDVTIKGKPINPENIRMMFDEIIQIAIDDDITFEFKNMSEIREGDDYKGYRVHLIGRFTPMAVPLKLDITTGDKITPKEIQYEYKTMFGEKSIPVLAYNLETVMSEKLETILSRGDQTTRPRDYYDVYILWKLQQQNMNLEHLEAALTATANNRNTLELMKQYQDTITVVRGSAFMQDQWQKYQQSFDYAKEISFEETCDAIIDVMNKLELLM
ncbi:MAG: nucleotidyl transferase AbiEii/AbiGii toxin family protein [Methanimicrococcus sp.]|nr:nucleotidyl transferase AbiEii/AbiGii toxin family protein [Methanimicrococcus sp.]